VYFGKSFSGTTLIVQRIVHSSMLWGSGMADLAGSERDSASWLRGKNSIKRIASVWSRSEYIQTFPWQEKSAYRRLAVMAVIKGEEEEARFRRQDVKMPIQLSQRRFLGICNRG
jgi:hypothetical protein